MACGGECGAVADIEQVAEENPDAIHTVEVDYVQGLMPYQCRDIAFAMGLNAKQAGMLTRIMIGIYNLFNAKDLALVELNPLAIIKGGGLMALDGKVNSDDNADFRRPELVAMRDESQEDATEVEAARHELNYVTMDGNIACMVNGAGLAMATMDVIKLNGGEPANFLDVGGSATEEAVTEGFRIILSDDAVKGVLVNIFGGIMRCDVIAQAIVNAAKEVGFNVPLVVRLEGTNVAEGRRILEGARGDIPTMQAGSDLADAAKKVCAAVG